MRKGIQHGIQRWWFRHSRRGIRAQRAMGVLRAWWRGQVRSVVYGVAGCLAPVTGMVQRRSRQVQRQRGAVTAEYAIAMLATAVILIRVWNMLCWRADSRSLVRVVRVPSM